LPLNGFLTHIFTNQNKLHLDEILKRNTQLEIITEIAKSITVEMSFEEMMDSITKKLYKVISYDLLSFFLIEGDKLIIRTGVPKDVPVLGIGTVLHSHSAMTWKVVRDKTPLIRHNLENDSQIYDEDKDLLSLDINSVVIVPLLIKNKVIGTLNLGSRQCSAYRETDVIFLQKVADQLALCIENSRLYAEERRLKREWEKAYQNANFLAEEMAKRNLQLEIINQLARSITVETSFDEILENMSFSLKKVISYDLLSFSLLEEKGLVIKKGIAKEPSILGEGTVLHPANSAPAKVMQEKRAIIRRDIPNEKTPFHEDPELKLLNINSSVIVPLIVKQKVIGTLNLASEQKNAYSEEDASFLQQVADHLAMCIENARLYAEESRIKHSWEETFKAVTDMLIVIDQKCEIVRYNEAASQLKNENPSSQRLASQPIKELNKASGYSLKEKGDQKDKKEEDKEILKICFLSKYWNCSLCPAKKTFSIRRPVGQRFCLESGKTLDVAAYPIFNEKGEVNEAVISIRDITDKMYMEAQLIQSAKLAAIGEIAAGVAHELNSPLTAIIGNALLLQRDVRIDPPEKRELLNDIHDCGVRCSKIIQNLRSFARQEDFSFELLKLDEVIEETLLLVRFQLEKNRIKLFKKIQTGLPQVIGSRQHLEQLLLNLIINARDALEETEKREIHIEAYRHADFVCVSIKDTGCGIEEQNLSRIFSPFFTTKERSKGTGLGLSISKNIAEAHRGRIEVISRIGEGSTFSLLLPVQDDLDLAK